MANARLQRAQQDENKYTAGLREERTVSDPICCIIFMLTLAAMFGAGIYGYSNGSVYKLVVPFDTEGNPCTGDYPLAYFYNLHQFTAGSNDITVYNSVCVSACPKANEAPKCAPERQSSCNAIAAYQDTDNTAVKTYCLPNLAQAGKQLDEFFRAIGES